MKQKYTRDYLVKYDKKKKFIPLTRDYLFKAVMTRNPEIFKKFLMKLMRLKLKPSDTNIRFLDKELYKSTENEHAKILDLNIELGDRLIINVEMNSKFFKIVKRRNMLYLEKLDLMLFETGMTYKDLEDYYVCQINLNAEEKNMEYGSKDIYFYDKTHDEIFDDRLAISIKYLEYYQRMYYTNCNKMKYDEIFMAGLMSKSYTELFDIMSKILSIKELNNFIESVIEMSSEWVILSEWQKDKMDMLVRNTELKHAKEEAHEEGHEEGINQGIEKGIEQGIEQIIKKMLKNNMTIEEISKITDIPISKIEEINNN